MNSWFTVKVKYTKQLESGSLKRVNEPYLLTAMSFTDAEARIYDELGPTIKGEFIIDAIKRTELTEIFRFEDSDVWYKCQIKFSYGGEDESEDGETKTKVVRHTYMVTANSVKEANDRLKESLKTFMADYEITGVVVTNVVDIFQDFESDDSPTTENTSSDEEE